MIFNWIIVSVFAENVYILGSQETKECIVVDPGAQAERLIAELDKLGLKAKLIACTHGHPDHIGGVAALKEATGASFAMHPKDIPLLKGGSPSIMSMLPGFREPAPPEIQVKDGDKLDVGEVRLEVIETPGHTAGSVCFYSPADGVLFTGDTLFKGAIGRFDGPGGDGQQLIQSIVTKLLPLPEETIVRPGHGPDTTIREEKRNNPFLKPGAVLWR